MSLPIPKRVPKLGFYHHYKHDPNGPVNNYAYEVVGIGFHTEDDCRPGEEHFVIYRPLYESSVYTASEELGVECFDARPLEMWMGEVEKDGQMRPRFVRITDEATIQALEIISEKMYV
jgi:hypothetical protein